MRIEQLAEVMPPVRQPVWLRLRGMHSAPMGEAQAEAREARRVALAELQRKGYRLVAFVRWGNNTWANGVREEGRGPRTPVDLREAFERCRSLAMAYGDLVDFWEIENEPDIGFLAENAETYAAFFKAASLGVRSGLRAIAVDEARVVMAPMALPPGPYFQRLLDCDVLSYTDAFNYHYYGYAEDFEGVYRQFESAVEAMMEEKAGRETRWDWQGRPSGGWGRTLGEKLKTERLKTEMAGQPRPLPVLLTEYGYGLLDHMQRDTVEGRVRQWAWFREVERQADALKIEGPMAFYLMPYYERGINEFGLWTKSVAGEKTKSSLLAGGVKFTPGDFGEQKTVPWMRRIGERTDSMDASPALAWLLSRALDRKRGPSRSWSVRTSPASNVVIDFVPESGGGLTQIKDFGGYLVGESEGRLHGRGKLAVYNFSDHPMVGELRLPEGLRRTDATEAGGREASLLLASGERREIAVEVGLERRDFGESEIEVAFVEIPGTEIQTRDTAVARWRTSLFPSPKGMSWLTRHDFSFGQESATENRARLLDRPLMTGEPLMKPNEDAKGEGWLATDGARVEDDGDVWRFYVTKFPPNPVRPVMVELPLPDGMRFDDQDIVAFNYRCATQSEVEGAVRLKSDDPDPRLRPVSGEFGDMMEVYFRTQNGNLYSSAFRLRAGSEWKNFVLPAKSLTMAFWGRAGLPWRFTENRPVSLVFFLRPSSLPAVFEIRYMELGRWVMSGKSN